MIFLNHPHYDKLKRLLMSLLTSRHFGKYPLLLSIQLRFTQEVCIIWDSVWLLESKTLLKLLLLCRENKSPSFHEPNSLLRTLKNHMFAGIQTLFQAYLVFLIFSSFFTSSNTSDHQNRRYRSYFYYLQVLQGNCHNRLL